MAHTKPEPYKILREFLVSGDSGLQMRHLVDGVAACVNNAERLSRDAALMRTGGSVASAAFLLTTAREEISKAHILFDVCRLDPSRHGSALTGLCKAFYSHVAKYAYLQVLEIPRPLQNMADVLEVWEVNVRKWWPESIDSGVPSMPHGTYFERELPLYVDFSDWDRDWVVPQNQGDESILALLSNDSRFNELAHRTSAWRVIEDLGLLTPNAFSVVREVMSQSYFGHTSSRADLLRALGTLEKSLQGQMRASVPWASLNLPFSVWPLYHAVTTGF